MQPRSETAVRPLVEIRSPTAAMSDGAVIDAVASRKKRRPRRQTRSIRAVIIRKFDGVRTYCVDVRGSFSVIAVTAQMIRS